MLMIAPQGYSPPAVEKYDKIPATSFSFHNPLCLCKTFAADSLKEKKTRITTNISSELYSYETFLNDK